MFKRPFKRREMQWCCIGFKAGYESAGRRGTAYLVGSDSLDVPEFVIQHRAVDKGDESHIQSDVAATIITDSRIVFCPSCGVNLAQFYEGYMNALFRDDLGLDILKKHNSFELTPAD